MRPLPVRAESRTIELWGREVAARRGRGRRRRRGRRGRRRSPGPRLARRGVRRGEASSGGARRSSPAAASWSTFTSSAASPPVSAVIEERVLPRWPYRLPREQRGRRRACARADKVARAPAARRATRPVRARGWRTREGYVHIRAESVDPASVEHPIVPEDASRAEAIRPVRPKLGIAIERIRFSLAVEDDMGEFFETFKRDPLARARRSITSPGCGRKRRPWPWEALCWAITAQLIEASRAAEIQRRIVRRWAPSYLPPPARRRGAAASAVAPARRSLGRGDRRSGARRARLDGPEPGPLAWRWCAARARSPTGRARPRRSGRRPPPARDPARSGRGPIQCLGLHGRGDPGLAARRATSPT